MTTTQLNECAERIAQEVDKLHCPGDPWPYAKEKVKQLILTDPFIQSLLSKAMKYDESHVEENKH